MTQWHFNSNMESWANVNGTAFAWDAAGGYSGGGLKGNNMQVGNSVAVTIASTPVSIGNPFSFRCRVTAPNAGGIVDGNPKIEMTVTVNAADDGSASQTFSAGSTVDYDSGWVLISGTINEIGNATLITIDMPTGGDSIADVYIDDVYFLETPTTFTLTHSDDGIPGAF